MKYGLITIDTPSSNRGNRLIEWALKRVLDLPEPSVIAPMFAPLTDEAVEQMNECDFVLLAGSTILADAAGNSDAMRSLHRLTVPVFCASGSGWAPYAAYLPYEVLRHITAPIGVRDPHALAYCEGIGLRAEMVGCPTAYVEEVEQVEGTYDSIVVLGYGRTNLDWQRNLFSQIHNVSQVIVGIQEQAFELPLAKEDGLAAFSYDCGETVYKMFSWCSRIFTGRLHGALPAMSQRLPVCFFGDKEDSRFSLLKHLGVPVHPMQGDIPKPTHPREYKEPLAKMKASFLSWASRTIGQDST